MFAEFAIEPVFESRSHLSQYLPHLGPESGRLVGAVPTRWTAQVEKALGKLNLSVIEWSIAYEYLNAANAVRTLALQSASISADTEDDNEIAAA